jgi:hypothetical protein
VPTQPIPGKIVKHITNEELMSALVTALTALGAQIAANNNAANAAHFATIDAHLAKLDSEEGADEATIADTTAGLQAFIAAANGTSSAAGSAAAGTAPATTAQGA